MSDLTEREILPMAEEEIAKLKAAVNRRWDDKPHYVGISPGCMMRAEEILALIKAYEDMKADYLRRHTDACDRFLEIDRLTRELAEARRERDEAIARANQVGEHTAKLMAAVGGVYADAMKEKP